MNTADVDATISDFVKATEHQPPEFSEEAIGRSVAHFYGRQHYWGAAQTLAHCLNYDRFLRQLAH